MLGCYWLTMERDGARGENKIFSSTQEVRVAYDAGAVEEHARIKVRIGDELVQTTVGRVILSEILPDKIAFSEANLLMTKKQITKLVDRVYRLAGLHDVVVMLDRLKDLGFSYATRAGVSICIDTPAKIAFSEANQLMTKKHITKLVDRVYRLAGLHDVVVMLDLLTEILI